LEEQGIRRNKVFKADFLDSYGYYLNFDRQLSLDKTRSARLIGRVRFNFILVQGVRQIEEGGYDTLLNNNIKPWSISMLLI